jgi:N-acyl homoserine lactone hydrolase
MMVTAHVRSNTARRLWALPGAMFTGMSRPEYQGGVMVQMPDAVQIEMPCPSFLIEHERGLVLFDTGVSPKGLSAPDRYFPNLVQQLKFDCRPDLGVDAQLRSLGYRLDQIRYVVPSHLHFDHAGGLYLFPDATFLVGTGEIGYAYQPDDGYRPYFLLEDIVPTRDFRWIEVGHDFDLFGDGSVQLLFSPGHTPGSLALFVRLPSRNLILTGDTCHYRTEIEHGVASTLHDQISGLASLRRLILLRDAWDAQIWTGHDIDDWNAWPHAPAHID